MSIRQIAGVVGCLAAGWLLWQGVSAVLTYTSRGGDLYGALMDPPTSALRIVAASAMVLGGLLTAVKLPGGGWCFGIGALTFSTLTAAMALSGADQTLWADEAVISAFAILLAAMLALLKRHHRDLHQQF